MRILTVFHCPDCHVVLGASNCLLELDYSTAECFYFSRVVNTKFGKKLLIDNESTYKEILCAKCNRLLGKHYRATTSELDHIRHCYGLYISVVEASSVPNPGKKITNTVNKSIISDTITSEGTPTTVTTGEIMTVVTILHGTCCTNSERCTTLEKRTSTLDQRLTNLEEVIMCFKKSAVNT